MTQMNMSTKEKKTNMRVVANGEEVGRGVDWEFGGLANANYYTQQNGWKATC